MPLRYQSMSQEQIESRERLSRQEEECCNKIKLYCCICSMILLVVYFIVSATVLLVYTAKEHYSYETDDGSGDLDIII
jgi:hypothetical protein